MNNIDNGQAPFQIDVTFSDNETSAMHYHTDPCNATTYLDESECDVIPVSDVYIGLLICAF